MKNRYGFVIGYTNDDGAYVYTAPESFLQLTSIVKPTRFCCSENHSLPGSSVKLREKAIMESRRSGPGSRRPFPEYRSSY